MHKNALILKYLYEDKCTFFVQDSDLDKKMREKSMSLFLERSDTQKENNKIDTPFLQKIHQIVSVAMAILHFDLTPS